MRLPYVDIAIASAGIALLAICGGCVSEDVTSVVVGEQTILPELTDGSRSSASIRIYESIKGASIHTHRDSKMTVSYSNAYTNSYLGIVTTHDSMSLKVEVEPLDVRGCDESNE